MDRMDTLSASERSQLVRWLVNRQKQGFNGRPDKDDDTCYTFWIGIRFISIFVIFHFRYVIRKKKIYVGGKHRKEIFIILKIICIHKILNTNIKTSFSYLFSKLKSEK